MVDWVDPREDRCREKKEEGRVKKAKRLGENPREREMAEKAQIENGKRKRKRQNGHPEWTKSLTKREESWMKIAKGSKEKESS